MGRFKQRLPLGEKKLEYLVQAQFKVNETMTTARSSECT